MDGETRIARHPVPERPTPRTRSPRSHHHDPDVDFCDCGRHRAAWDKEHPGVPIFPTPSAIASLAGTAHACVNRITRIYADKPPDRVFRVDWSQNSTLEFHLLQNEPGSTPTSAPILIVQGTADNLIPESTTARLVDHRLCRTQRDTVEYRTFRGADHGTVLDAAQSVVLRWIGARFTGRTAPNTCRRAIRRIP